MPETEAWTIRRLLAWTAKYLSEHGSDTPKLDADLLLAEARGSSRMDLYLAQDEVPSDEVRTAFRELVRRRAEGAPVAYLLGRKDFFTLEFTVSPAVLIPRPDTEHLVTTLLDLAKQAPGEQRLRLLDVGTGSGAIAVTAAKQEPRLDVVAVDLSPEALAIAQGNAQRHGVAERIRFVESDLFTGVAGEEPFDFLASNPPYLRSDEIPGLMEDVRRFEPRMAMEAGTRGTEFHERIIDQGAALLRPGGHLLLEMGYQQRAAVEALIANDPRYQWLQAVRDSGGHDRVALARRV